MADEKNKPDDGDEIIPFDLEEQTDQPRMQPADSPAKSQGDPLDLEPGADPPPSEARAEHDERCPNCGALMPERDALVCLRCGYDLQRLEVARTRVEKPVEIDEEHEAATTGPVSRPGRGDVWLPLAMAGISGLLLIIGHLAGVLSLYPDVVAAAPQGTEVSVSLNTRLMSVLQLLVLIGLWSVCGLAGLFLLAQALQRPVGEMKLAAARMLGMIATIRLATFLALPGPRWVEWLTESLLQAAAFVGLSILLYALKPRDGAMMGGFALAALLGLWLFARAMVWALEGGV